MKIEHSMQCVFHFVMRLMFNTLIHILNYKLKIPLKIAIPTLAYTPTLVFHAPKPVLGKLYCQ